MMSAAMATQTVSLGWLLEDLGQGPEACRVAGLTLDSRAVRPGDLFLAVAGERQHGLAYAAAAERAGAAAVAYDPSGAPEPAVDRVPCIPVAELGRHAGAIAARFYGEPARSLSISGVTGTDGKTTCAYLLAQCLEPRRGCGFIGTLGSGRPGALARGTLTSPDPVTLQAQLADFRGQGLRCVAMEVSSHALVQHRVDAVPFHAALFTNLGRDHLDYHVDQAAYRRAKRRLFEMASLRLAAINADDPAAEEMASAVPEGCRVIRFSLEREGDGEAGDWLGTRSLELHEAGCRLTVVGGGTSATLELPLVGRFNAANALGVLAMLTGLGVTARQAVKRLSQARPAPGRMEPYGGRQRPLVVIDYAHTPEALDQALAACRAHCRGKLICGFGCGGERDPGKRPMMGAAAERGSDRLIVTDDNPRGEPAQAITESIVAGLTEPARAVVEHDRGLAIRRAIAEAAPGDVVLIAGKGHERVQERAEGSVPFADAEHVGEALGEYRA